MTTQQVIVVPKGSLKHTSVFKDTDTIKYVEDDGSGPKEQTCSCKPCTRHEGICPKNQNGER